MCGGVGRTTCSDTDEIGPEVARVLLFRRRIGQRFNAEWCHRHGLRGCNAEQREREAKRRGKAHCKGEHRLRKRLAVEGAEHRAVPQSRRVGVGTADEHHRNRAARKNRGCDAANAEAGEATAAVRAHHDEIGARQGCLFEQGLHRDTIGLVRFRREPLRAECRYLRIETLPIGLLEVDHECRVEYFDMCVGKRDRKVACRVEHIDEMQRGARSLRDFCSNGQGTFAERRAVGGNKHGVEHAVSCSPRRAGASANGGDGGCIRYLDGNLFPDCVMPLSRPFETQERVRWADVDLVGIMRYSAFTRLVELAEQEMMREAGLPYSQFFEAPEIWLPRRALSIEYFAPVRIDDLLLLRSYVSRVGDSSLTISVDVYAADAGTLVATAALTIVCVTVATFTKRPMPAEIRDALAPFTLTVDEARALLPRQR